MPTFKNDDRLSVFSLPSVFSRLFEEALWSFK
jgi:hypothetical protein